MQGKPSLAGRAAWAVVLMIGFYLVAAAIVAVLIYLPYAEIRYAHRIHLNVLIFCGVGLFAILRALMPRADKFVPPGPRLHAEKHRRLFKELENVAARVSQPMPTEVYLVPNVNAWVAHRGGIMGFGSRPVMGLGLPLLRVLTIPELRAVLAHEFGHYHGGDVKLAPWIYKTREAIIRTLQNLEGRMLSLPFLWYGKMFLRITNAISRQQEFRADALAAEVTGAQTMKKGLKKVHEAGRAFVPFWENEVSPVLSAGFLPPIATGFKAFLKEKKISSWIAEQVKQEMSDPQASPYDTHPSLRDRLAALDKATEARETPDDHSAFDLLEHPESLEEEMIGLLGKPRNGAAWQTICWEEVCEKILLPAWIIQAEKYGALLDGIRLGKLCEYAATPDALVERFDPHFGDDVTPPQKVAIAQSIVGATVGVLLHKRGWKLESKPGQPVIARLGDVKVLPFGLLADLKSGQLSGAAWDEICCNTGISDVDLGEAAPTAPVETSSSSEESPLAAMELEASACAPETVWIDAPSGQSWACPQCGEINQALYDCCYRCGDKVQRRIVPV